eukprot:gene12147-15258_t
MSFDRAAVADRLAAKVLSPFCSETKLATDSASAPMVCSFALVYTEMSFDRAAAAKRLAAMFVVTVLLLSLSALGPLWHSRRQTCLCPASASGPSASAIGL